MLTVILTGSVEPAAGLGVVGLVGVLEAETARGLGEGVLGPGEGGPPATGVPAGVRPNTLSLNPPLPLPLGRPLGLLSVTLADGVDIELLETPRPAVLGVEVGLESVS
jgi:hypothetical protein